MKTSAATDPRRAPLVDTATLEGLLLQVQAHWQAQRRSHRFARPYAGPLPALLRGQGLELHDRRPYQAGDDLRHLDWRAMARSGRPLTKVYLEEGGRELFLLLDRRAGMRFGSRHEPKAACAARTAAILAFAALCAGERTGGMVVEGEARHFPASATLAGLHPLLQAAAAPLPERPPPPCELAHLWPRVAQHCQPGVQLCLISDFRRLEDWPQEALQGLARRCEIHAFQICDRGEASLPKRGRLCLHDEQGREYLVDCRDAALRRDYAAAIEGWQRRLQARLHAAGIPLTVVYNHRDTFRQLIQSH